MAKQEPAPGDFWFDLIRPWRGPDRVPARVRAGPGLPDDAIGFAKIFLSTPFSGAARHARRLAEIADYEKTGELPPLPA